MKLVALLTWHPVADGLPEPETSVLLGLSDGKTCEGFYNPEPGRDVWYDAGTFVIDDRAVLYWADMPSCPPCPASAAAIDTLQTAAYAEGRDDEAEARTQTGVSNG